MVSEAKKQEVKEMKEELKKYSAIGLLDMHKLPASQLHEIRNKLRSDVKIKMVKKRLIKIILNEVGMAGIEKLNEQLGSQPALLLSNANPFKLARLIEENKSKAAAVEGDIAPEDITIQAGPTPFAAGPAIGELQKAGLKVMVQDGKIAVSKDAVVAKKGAAISKDVAAVLSKLDVKPMQIGLNLVCSWEAGLVYGKEILFVPIERYVTDIMACASSALNLSVNINYPTADSISIMLSKAHSESLSLAREAKILTPDTVGDVLARASAEAAALEKMIEKK